MSSTGRSESLLYHEDLPLPVEIRGVRGARGLRLRLDQRRNLLKLTGPVRMNRKAALAWAAEQRAWVHEQLESLLPHEPFVPGAFVPVEGVDRLLAWWEAEPRTPRLERERLVAGGPRPGYARRIELFLKRHALDVLSRETADIAVPAGLSPSSVAVGDAETRWGSCSSDRRIRYSWRLILAPPAARRYVVAHEVAHLAHMNHGPEFKALERQLFGGDPAPARALLRRLGPRLKRIGRGD